MNTGGNNMGPSVTRRETAQGNPTEVRTVVINREVQVIKSGILYINLEVGAMKSNDYWLPVIHILSCIIIHSPLCLFGAFEFISI